MRLVIIALLLYCSCLSGRGQNYFEHYEEALGHVATDSLNLAIKGFEQALKLRSKDNFQARTYGVNFIEYFPNRELGIIYYRQKDYDKAISYLERSMEQAPSERAEEYLLYIGQIKHDRNLSVTDSKPPEIEVLLPERSSAKVFQPVSNNIKEIAILGKANDPGGIMEVLVNESEAVLSATGEFKASIPLTVGQNEIFIRATDKSQNSITRSFLIYRADTLLSELTPFYEEGRYYALIIGISEYTDPLMTDLDNFPIEDTKRLVEVLTDNYTFNQDDIIYLNNPTRAEIMRSFDYLSKTVTTKDNLLIFYAGHGYYDQDTELGYWLPADAEKEFTANWIYNDVLVANVKRIKSKHTLLISDACFSGSIFKTRALVDDAPAAFQKKYELISRKAITSGVLKTVPNQSIFFKYLAERLENNPDKFLAGSQLFQDIEIPVANNSPNTPQYGVIRDVGDEGGDFIFIKK